MKPAENETSKEPQSWAEAAKAAGVLVLSSQEQFDEVIVETAPKKSATKKTPKEYRLEEPKKKGGQFLGNGWISNRVVRNPTKGSNQQMVENLSTPGGNSE